MNAETKNPLKIQDEDEILPREVGDPIPDLNMLEQTASAYGVMDLTSTIEFAKMMSQAGPMIPAHCQRQPGVCLAIYYRAVHWGIDPFGLALESYQAKSGDPVSYMASVFAAVLVKNGINLEYEYTGETHFTAAAAQSSKGNKVADQTAAGTRQCTVTAEIDGKPRSYTTPMLKDIKVKNSPLWHNDPDQQLGYYAVRAWARRYRSDLMLGAMSVEDVRDASPMRNVTPRDEASGGFSKMIAKARENKAEPDEEPDNDSPPEGDQGEPDIDINSAPPEVDIDHPAYVMGAQACEGGIGAGECPFREDPDAARHWLAGWESITQNDPEDVSHETDENEGEDQ